jgi:hypothetical protein
VGFRKRVISVLRGEFNDLETMSCAIEERMAQSREQQRNPDASPRKRPALLDILNPPFEEPEFGLWVSGRHLI